MNQTEVNRFNNLYQRHLRLLKLQGKSQKTIDAYSRAVRRIREYFDCCPDQLTLEQLLFVCAWSARRNQKNVNNMLAIPSMIHNHDKPRNPTISRQTQVTVRITKISRNTGHCFKPLGGRRRSTRRGSM